MFSSTMTSRVALSLILLATSSIAAPAETGPITKRAAAVSAVATTQIDTLINYAWFSNAAYCPPAVLSTWTCGENCDQNPQFKVVASGGDGTLTQYWYVGYDSKVQSVIVGHQGSKFSNILPALTDLAFLPTPLNQKLFPSVPTTLLAHVGFQTAQALVVKDVTAAVTKAMSTYSTKSVTTVGHSLGGAISLLDALYFKIHLPSDTSISFHGYGTPRVGNQEFADYIDNAGFTANTHVINKRDTVSALPPRVFGFAHPSGEVHIDNPSGTWYTCAGQENTDARCFSGDVPLLLFSNASDHNGPYGPVHMDGSTCTPSN